jgi:histidyl-tRNA synthetase
MNDIPKKSAAVKARLPRGLADRGPAEIAATNRMIEKIRLSYELYGFEAVETPFIEYTEALGKFLPDQDRPNEGVFSFQDDDEQWLSLRYDLTAPLARYVAENYDRLPKPYRSYRAGFVFRNEKPGPGRFRQFMQFDADTVGAASVAADAEMCMMAADTLEALGIKRGDYVIKVNNRKVLDGVMEAIGLGGDENAARRLTVLRAVDKYDRLGAEGVQLLLGAGRKDESGDFTKGAGLGAKDIEGILYLLDLSQHAETMMAEMPMPAASLEGVEREARRANGIFSALLRVLPSSGVGVKGVSELHEMWALVRSGGYDDGRIRIDPSVVRGLEYYTGPVFEADLLIDVRNDQGHPVRFGSVGGGGRYDGLVARFRGEPVPATGFSIGVSRLLSALKAVGSPLAEAEDKRGPVVVLVMDKEEIAHYQGLVARLRAAGIRSELYLGQAGMNAQLKYADRRGAVCAIIQGSNERNAAGGPQVTIRDLVLGAELAAASKDRADYLELRQRAQFPVAENLLVEAVEEVLGRYRR